VVDAAGAIYVIGGYNGVIDGQYGGTTFQDVWASTDGGARRTRAGGQRVLSGFHVEYSAVLQGYLRGT
jgi:hypothetical protein